MLLDYNGPRFRRTKYTVDAFKSRSPADVLFIVWTDQAGKKRKIRYTKDNLLSVTGLMGDSLEPKADRSREAEVKIDGIAGPIYLLWKRAPGYSAANATGNQ